MNVRQYQLGKKHGLEGKPSMNHRRFPYDSRSAQHAYDLGYMEGRKERYIKQKQAGHRQDSKS